MFRKTGFYLRLIASIFPFLAAEIRRASNSLVVNTQAKLLGATPSAARHKNIVIVGASFSGHHAARILASCLPAKTDYQIVVIEPNSHFQFTWVLPRYCVAKGHEHKAFIPYGKYATGPDGAIKWIKSRVTTIDKTTITLSNGEEVPYEFLLIATGASVSGLPSRVNETDKKEGIKLLQAMQHRIEQANTLVVVGGGAAGVELATDAKSLYKKKKVILVHSRKAPMHRFGPRLQEAAIAGLKQLGVELILEDRVVEQTDCMIRLKSGRSIDCDCVVNCTGQSPNSEILRSLSPTSLTSTGHIKVKPTLQIADDVHPNIFSCGDVTDTDVPTPNARSAMAQSMVAAENILLATRGKTPTSCYNHHWGEELIKLTLGLDRSVTYLSDGETELLFESKEKDEALMAAMCWKRLGHTPFKDEYE